MNSCMTLAPRALSTAVLFSGLCVSVAAFTVATISMEHAAFAQTSPTPTAASANAKTPYEATLAKDSAVRCASNLETGYVFGQLTKGSAVRVIQEVSGWARIATTGSAFDGWAGFVKSAPGITLSADGKTIKITSRAEITAVNSERNFDPDASYRAIGFLVNGDEATVTEQLTGDGGAIYYAVALSAKTSGWIQLDALTPTTTTTTPPASTTTPTIPGTTTTDAAVVNPGTRVTTDIDTETGQEITTTIPATTDTATDGTKPTTTKPVTRAAVVEQIKRVRVADLNASYKALRAQPTETAEFEALRERCLAIAEDPKSFKGEIDSAKFLAQKVLIDITIQAQRRKLDSNFKGVADLELATLARMPYDNVGRLNASKFYTGERMPLLYVLQDQGTGYTIAYIVPGETTEYSSMLGLLVGVKGPVRYDESLRLNVIAPISIVPITPKTTGTTTPEASTVTATATENTTPTEK
jgi:hypothetical protein